MTRKYEDFIRLCLHWGTGLAKRSVLCTRLISGGLIFQMHGWVRGKTLLLIIPGRQGNVICGPILAISVTVWVSVWQTDRKGYGVCLGILEYMKLCVMSYGAWEDYMYSVYLGGLDGPAQLTQIWSTRSTSTSINPPTQTPTKTHEWLWSMRKMCLCQCAQRLSVWTQA